MSRTPFGGSGPDTLIGTVGANVLTGGPGKDTLARRASATIVWTAATAEIVSDYASSDGRGDGEPRLRATATGQGTDVLTSVENATGSIVRRRRSPGTTLANAIKGGAGGDTIGGAGGSDRLQGGDGADRLGGGGGAAIVSVGGRGNDRGDAGGGNDLWKGGAGRDHHRRGRGA